MFYYPVILNRQNGCFSTIWLVATGGKKVGKREILKVNVPKTCHDLMDYILARVPPPQPGLAKPRLSLYLSSLLQYGVIKVYHQQCNILLKDTKDVVETLEKFKVKRKIDMGKPGGAISLPDALSAMETHGWADDPFFGEMIDFASVSPSAIARMAGSFHSALSPPSSSSSSGLQDSITAHPADITMKETPSAVLPIPEFQFEEAAGFGEGDKDFIDYLSEMSDDAFGFGAAGSHPIETGAGAEPPKEAVLPPAASPRATPPLQDLPVVYTPEDRTAATEGDEAVPTPPRRGVKRRRQGLSSPLQAVPTPPRRGVKRRRQPRLVVDRVTTISREAFEEQQRNLFANLADPPMAGGVREDAASLLTRPCNVLPVELMPLWDRVAVIRSYAERQSEQRPESSGYSSSEAPSEDIHPTSGVDISDPSREQLVTERQISTAVGSPGSLEGVPDGGMDVEMEPVVEAGGDMGIEVEGPAEAMDVGPEGEEEDDGPDRRAAFMGLFEEMEADEDRVSLRSMLGEGVPSRKIVALAFMTLLEHYTARTLIAEQEEPFDDIWISRVSLSQE